MPSLADLIPEISAYHGAQTIAQDRQAKELAQIGALQGILAKAREQQLATQFRAELEAAPTDEAKAAVAMKYGTPQAIMGHADTQAKIANTKEIAFQRLTQQAQNAARQATTADEKAQVDKWYKQGVLAIQQGRAAYELPPEFAPKPVAAPQSALPSYDQAMATMGGGVNKPFTMQVDPASPQPVQQAPVATPAPAPTPAPSASPAAPTAAATLPAMPPEIARASRKVQDNWALAMAKGGQADRPQGDFSKTGDDYLATLPESDRQLVKKLASYEIDPKTLSQRGGHREKMLAQVAQYDPNFDDTQYANKRRAIQQFGSGPQGNTVRSLNVAVEHLDTLQRAADALKNGDFTPGNKAYNEVAKVFGVTPPNTFEGIRDIVANEVVKGTIGTSGALTDRAEAAAKVKAASSPAQLKELMNAWTELMGGQVKGLEQQYEGATGLKDFRERYLRQRTRDAIALAESKAKPAAPTGGKWTITPIQQ